MAVNASRQTGKTVEELYAQAIHPRVHFDKQELATLRRQTRKGVGKKILDGMASFVTPSVSHILACEDMAQELIDNGNPSKVGYDHITVKLKFILPEIALVGYLADREDCIAAVCGMLETMTDAKGSMRWGVHPDTILVALDLMYHQLEPTARDRLVRALASEVLRPSMKSLKAQPVYSGAGGNHAAALMNTCMMTLLTIWNEPQVGDLTAERDELIRMLEAHAYSAIGIDGYPEEDTGYGTGVACNLYRVAEAMRRSGWKNLFADCPRLTKFPAAMLYLSQPQGRHLTNTGDHGDGMDYRTFPLLRCAADTKDPALHWLDTTLVQDFNTHEVPLGKGRQISGSLQTLMALSEFLDVKPEHPGKRADRPTAWRERDRGLVSFRSAWHADATLLTVDGSQRRPGAPGHAHASCGHFNISALGEFFAIDTGRYNAEQDQHNLVLIDGKSGRSTEGEWKGMNHAGRLVDYAPGDLCDFTSVDSSLQHDCYWAFRGVGLVKGGHAKQQGYVWTVDDVNKCDDWAEYWWALNTSVENKIKTSKNRASIVGCRQGNVMDLAWAIPQKKDYSKAHVITEITQDIQTTSSYEYVPDPYTERVVTPPRDSLHTTALHRPRLLVKFQGYNGKIMSVMVPRSSGNAQARPTIKQIASVPNSLAMQVVFPDVTDTIIWSFEHHLLEAGDVMARGKWCVVRQSNKTGKCLSHEIHEGDMLSVKGTSIRL